jgi:tRNA pseudouridine55 synthase
MTDLGSPPVTAAAAAGPATAPRADGHASTGRRRRSPAEIHGVIALDKPQGMTSFAAVREVRRLLDERRVGHAGTLDPMATGLLPICVGSATRLVDYLHQQSKRYHCRVRLGERSDTMDLEGEVTVAGDASALDSGAVEAVLPRFLGDFEQRPPMHSAVRHEGRHLYELAREGVEVERQARTVHIDSIEVLSFQPGTVAEVELDVVCGKGTYMRVLASDIGDALGTGGLLSWLSRTAYGTLTLAHSITLERLAALDDPRSALLPAWVAVEALPRIDLVSPLALQVSRGQSVWVPKLPDPRPSGTVRAHAPSGDLLAVGELTGGLFKPVKVFGAELP